MLSNLLIKCFILVVAFVGQVEAQIRQNEKTEIESVKTAKGDLQLIKHLTDDYAQEVSLKFKDKVLLKAPYQYISVKDKFGRQPEIFVSCLFRH